MDIHRSYYYYESNRDDSEVETAIREAAAHGEGFWKVYAIIRRKHDWNHKKVYRVYKALHFEKRSRLRKRLLPGLNFHWKRLQKRMIHGRLTLFQMPLSVEGSSGC